MRRLDRHLAAGAFLVAFQGNPSSPDIQTPLKNDPELSRFSWSQASAPSYAPLTLLAGAEPAGESCSTQELETLYGPAMTALVDLWRSEWALPLDLAASQSDARATLAFLPSFAIHKEIAAKKFPEEDTIPASYLIGEIAVTYLQGNSFESKGARRGAVMQRAAERLIALHRPTASGKPLPAWLHLGLASYLGDLREKGEKSFFAREESLSWRDALSRAAEELREKKIEPPGFDEILLAGPETELQAKPRSYREFVRLSGYSLILFFRARQTERFAKPFLSYLKREFGGEGGPERFRAELQSLATPFLKEWQAFCRGAIVPPEPAPGAPTPPSPTPSKRSGPSAGSLSPIALDMTPRTLVDLRAEVLRKARSGRFDEALHEVFDVREKQSDILKPHLAAEKRMLEAAMAIYEAFAKSCKPGDKLAAAFGHAGEIVRCHPDGSFEIREKSRVNRYPWTALSLQAVAKHAYGSLRRNAPEEILDHATAQLLCGDLESAKEAIALAMTNGASAPRAEWLRRMIPDFERALKEAKARDAFEEIASLEMTAAVEKLRRKLLDSDIRGSVAREYAKPFLQGMLSVHFGAQFEKSEAAGLFRGKARQQEGSLTLSYAFDGEAELSDWEPAESPALAKRFEAEGSEQKKAWRCSEGALRISSCGTRRHVTPWAGDLTVVVSFELPETAPAEDRAPAALAVGILGDGKGGFAVGKSAGGLRHLKIVRAGGRVSATLDGEAIQILEETDPALSGVFLSACGASEALVHELTIVGTIDTRSPWYQVKKANWVKREIAGLLGE